MSAWSKSDAPHFPFVDKEITNLMFCNHLSSASCCRFSFLQIFHVAAKVMIHFLYDFEVFSFFTVNVMSVLAQSQSILVIGPLG